MRRIQPALVLALASLLLAPLASAQSLGEAAAREREKKKKPGKVITEDELRNSRRPGSPANVATEAAPSPSPEASPAAQAAPGAPKEKTEDEIRAEQEKAWREKLKKAQADVTRLTAEVDRLQAAVNDLSGQVYGSARSNNLTRLEEAKKQLSAAQQSAADLQEEGRRARFTP